MIAIQTSSTEEIRVSWEQRAGRYYMEVRTYTTEGKPTEKSISLPMGRVPELIDALQKEGKEVLAKKGIAIRPGLVPELIDALRKESLAAADKEIERMTANPREGPDDC